MRVKLKGLNSTRAKLADGTVRTYWYAWKGGPRLPGKPGSPEFMASYNAAVSQRKIGPQGTLQYVMDLYERSSDFLQLAEHSRRDYRRHLKAIEIDYGDFPLSALADRRTRGEFLAWRDRLELKSRRNADYRMAVLARVLSWGLNRGLVLLNPLERPGRLYRANRNERIWTVDDEAAFLRAAPKHLQLALVLALWTGQRQGDLLRLTWSDYDGDWIRVRQQKTGARLSIPVGRPLKEALDEARKSTTSVTVLATTSGSSWTESGFRASWRKACEKAKVVGVTFHDLRGTAVTRLALAGCSVPEIATITGHSLRDVGSILDSHYLARDPAMAQSAIKKLERGTKTSK